MTDLIATRGDMVGKLWELKMAREFKSTATADDKRLTKQFKQWFTLNDESELFDGEHGILAALKTTATTTWDIRDAPAKLLARLAVEGLLTVNTAALNERRKSAPATYLDDALVYRHEGESLVLHVEQK